MRVFFFNYKQGMLSVIMENGCILLSNFLISFDFAKFCVDCVSYALSF